ncbi:MAG TPA: hypothetical protein VJS63_12140 [Bradyrhizobium sp.]|nr:hypothetical protein [Bradyrhizobium sp.]
MKNAARYRVWASLCRQHAAYDPAQNWKLLGQAERWERLAEGEISDHFQACNAACPDILSESELAA